MCAASLQAVNHLSCLSLPTGCDSEVEDGLSSLQEALAVLQQRCGIPVQEEPAVRRVPRSFPVPEKACLLQDPHPINRLHSTYQIVCFAHQTAMPIYCTYTARLKVHILPKLTLVRLESLFLNGLRTVMRGSTDFVSS